MLEIQYNRYIEPFLGSGAVFFSLSPPAAIISDSNKELIITYRAIRDNWRSVETLLRRHHENHCKEYYYTVRSEKPTLDTELAAWFIYLNRTCWNGLYRVNKQGVFNVPIGTKQNVLLGDNFSLLSAALQSAEILCCDFQTTLSGSGEGDLVYIDPPYTVHHNYNGFRKYNQKLFSWDDQIRLRSEVVKAKARGAKIFVSNAYHESVLHLYDSVGEITQIPRTSVISGKANGRRTQNEVLIKCF